MRPKNAADERLVDSIEEYAVHLVTSAVLFVCVPRIRQTFRYRHACRIGIASLAIAFTERLVALVAPLVIRHCF